MKWRNLGRFERDCKVETDIPPRAKVVANHLPSVSKSRSDRFVSAARRGNVSGDNFRDSSLRTCCVLAPISAAV